MSKISLLPQIATADIDGTETLPVVKGGVTKRLLASTLVQKLAQPFIDLANAWADGSAPGGAGTKSSKEWAAEAAGNAASISAQILNIDKGFGASLAIQRLFRFFSGEGLRIGDASGNELLRLDSNGLLAKLAAGSVGVNSLDDTMVENILALQRLRKIIRYSPVAGFQIGDGSGNYVTLLDADGKLTATFGSALKIARANLTADVASYVTDAVAAASPGILYTKTVSSKSQVFLLDGEGVETQISDGVANDAYPMLVGQSVRLSSDRDGGTPRAMRMLPSGKSLVTARGSKKVRIVVGWGQSLSNGTASIGTATAITQALAARGVLMFNGGVRVIPGLPTAASVVDPANIERLVPLAAQVATGATQYGQTIVESCCARMWNTRKIRSIGINVGVGGQAYTAIKKGTPAWSNMVTAVTRAVAILGALGWEAEVVMLCQHGEADAGVTRAVYSGYLNELVATLNADICPITGQSAVHVFAAQSPSLSQSQVPLAQWLVAQSNPLFHCIGPAYNLTYADGQHATSLGYHYLGEEYDRAIDVVLDQGLTWKPLQPASAVLAGSTVTVTLEGNTGSAVSDASLVAAIANKGIEYSDDTSPPAVSGVTVTASGLTVDLAAAPTGSASSRVLRGAWTRPGSVTPLDPARTNIRDSDPLVSSYDGHALPKWLVNFEIAVS